MQNTKFSFDYDPWRLLSSEPKKPRGVMTDEFIMKFTRYLNWNLLSIYYDFSMDMLRIYQHRVNWTSVLQRTKYPDFFLREMHLNFDSDAWYVVSKYQQLSEEFIHDFAERLDWECVGNYQMVSEEFMKDHAKYVENINDEEE